MPFSCTLFQVRYVSFRVEHMQSGAGYVYTDCPAFLGFTCPTRDRCPFCTRFENSSHPKLSLANNSASKTMSGLTVFFGPSNARCPACKQQHRHAKMLEWHEVKRHPSLMVEKDSCQRSSLMPEGSQKQSPSHMRAEETCGPNSRNVETAERSRRIWSESKY